MGATPARPDTGPTEVWARPTTATLVWITVATVVGFLALQVIVRIQDESGAQPPSSMFAAAGVIISVVSLVAVTLAARSSGVVPRAAIALGGGFAAIAMAKFALGPISRYGAAVSIQDTLGLGSAGSVLAIGCVVALLYAGVVLLLGAWLRPPRAGSPRVVTGIALLVVGTAALVFGAFFTDAPMSYLGALTGLEAVAVTVALFTAATLVAATFRDVSRQAQAIGTVSVYASVVWVAIAFLLVFHVLWVLFLLAVVSLWPLRTVTPK